MDLQALISALWKRKWILIIVPFIAICIAFLVRYFGEWKFVSTAQLTTGLTVADELIDKEKYFNPYEVQVAFTNLVEIMRSRSVINQVSYSLARHDFNDSTTAFHKLDKKKIEAKFKGDPNSYLPRFQVILKNKMDSLSLLNSGQEEQKLLQKFIDSYEYDYESILKYLTINRVNQSDFIEVTFTSDNAFLSAYVVNTLCSEFIRYYTSSKSSSSTISLESLESIAKQRKDYLDAKMEELKNFNSQHHVLNSEAEGEAKIRQVKNYEDQIAEVQQKIRGLELTIASLSLRISDAEVNSGIKPNDEIVNLRKRINVVNEKYIQGGQTDRALLDTLTFLRAKQDAAMQRINESPKVNAADLAILRNKREEARVELAIGRENFNSLNNIYTSMRFSMGSLANNEALGKALEKEVEVAREENRAAQNRLSEAKEKLMTNRISIKQILIAEPAEKAESRKTLIFMIFGGAFSFFMSAFVIIAIEIADSRIKTPQRFKQKTRLKLAGILPKLNNSELNWDVIFQAAGEHRHMNEEIRKIRFEIVNQKSRVLLVTSTKKNQGKSFFIIALAYSLSLLKKRTLIIDTNLRNNSLTRLLLAQPNLRLLVENFAKNTKLIGDSSDNSNPTFDVNLITRTQNGLIDIIGNKISQLSPSEIIPGGDFKVLLEWLKMEYDYILLEGPDLNSFSDSKELVRFADQVIPIFSADSSIEAQDLETLNYLKSLQDKLGPAILNNVEVTA